MKRLVNFDSIRIMEEIMLEVKSKVLSKQLDIGAMF